LALLELEVIGLSLRAQGHKAHEEFVITGLFALLQKRFGVVGVFKVTSQD